MTQQITILTDDSEWRATIDAEIAHDEWLECMAAAAADATLQQAARNLGAMVLAMMGCDAHMAAVELQDLQDGMDDEIFNRWGGA